MTLLGDNLFQSTLLQEERHVPSKRKEEKKIFQSTLLQEERHDSSLFDNLSFEFQSTLLQEERRQNAQLSLYLSVIIIA